MIFAIFMIALIVFSPVVGFIAALGLLLIEVAATVIGGIIAGILFLIGVIINLVTGNKE